MGGVTSIAHAFGEDSGRTVYSENPVAFHLGWVPPGLLEARTSCSVVIMCLLGLLLSLCREPHGWRLPINDLLGSGLATKVATWEKLALRVCLEGAAMSVSVSGQRVWKHIAMSEMCEVCCQVLPPRWVTTCQRLGALQNNYLKLSNPHKSH